MLVPIKSSLNTPVCSLKKSEASWKMAGDFCRHNKIEFPIAAVEPGVLSLLGQIYMALGTEYTTTDFINAFFSFPLK